MLLVGEVTSLTENLKLLEEMLVDASNPYTLAGGCCKFLIDWFPIFYPGAWLLFYEDLRNFILSLLKMIPPPPPPIL